jgi:hypothetical protein
LLSRAPDLKIYLEIIDFNVRVKPTHLRIGIRFEDPGGRIDFWKTLKRNKTQLEICIGSRDDYCQKADPFTD